jgi:phosphohistidine swiveling domain-containing protein
MSPATNASDSRVTHAAHFHITGEDFTRLARDFVLSDAPARAFRLVASGLRTKDGQDGGAVAVRILDGTCRMTGDSVQGIDVEPDPHGAPYRKQIEWLFAGRVRIDGAWYRPRACVVRAVPHQIQTAIASLPPFVHDPDEDGGVAGVRARDYLDDFSRALAEQVRYGGERVVRLGPHGETINGVRYRHVVFEPCAEPPFWMPETHTPETAVAASLAAGRSLAYEEIEARHIDDMMEERRPHTYSFEADVVYPENDADRQLRREQDRQDRQRENARTAMLAVLRAQIVADAGDAPDAWFELPYTTADGAATVARVPRAPFEQWALARTSLRHLARPWEARSPSGLKLPLDDRHHSDWMIGAGLPLEEAYGGPLHDAATHAMFELQRTLGQFECAVLCGDHAVTGVTGQDIVVLPDLHPDRIDAMAAARGVITGAGGAAAHLAQVALERGVPILRVPDAVARFPDGQTVTLDPQHGQIRVHVRHS